MSEEDDDPEIPENGPSIDLELYELSVSVDGVPGDDLDDVRETATETMEFLVEKHFEVERGPDDLDRY